MVKNGAAPPPPFPLLSLFLSKFWSAPMLDPAPISPGQVNAPIACRSAVSTPHPSPSGVPPLAGLFGELPSPHYGKMDSSRPPPLPGADGSLPHYRQRQGDQVAAVATAMASAHRAGAMEPGEDASPGQGLAGRIGRWPRV
jgi:hypothetical protein